MKIYKSVSNKKKIYVLIVNINLYINMEPTIR